jgi:hypothetical protein
MFNAKIALGPELAQRLEDLGNVQARESDKLKIAYKNMDVQLNNLENMLKESLEQLQRGNEERQENGQNDPSREESTV